MDDLGFHPGLFVWSHFESGLSQRLNRDIRAGAPAVYT